MGDHELPRQTPATPIVADSVPADLATACEPGCRCSCSLASPGPTTTGCVLRGGRRLWPLMAMAHVAATRAQDGGTPLYYVDAAMPLQPVDASRLLRTQAMLTSEGTVIGSRHRSEPTTGRSRAPS